MSQDRPTRQSPPPRVSKSSSLSGRAAANGGLRTSSSSSSLSPSSPPRRRGAGDTTTSGSSSSHHALASSTSAMTNSSPRTHRSRASLGYSTGSSGVGASGGSTTTTTSAGAGAGGATRHPATNAGTGTGSAASSEQISFFSQHSSIFSPSSLSSSSSTSTSTPSATTQTASRPVVSRMRSGTNAVASASASIRAEQRATGATATSSTSPRTPGRTSSISARGRSSPPTGYLDFPSLATTSPPVGLAKNSPRLDSASSGDSPRSTPRVHATSIMASAKPRSSLGPSATTPSSPPRRKPAPPPLNIDPSPPRGSQSKGKVTARGDFSDSSDVDALPGSTTKRSKDSSMRSADDYADWSMPPGSDSAGAAEKPTTPTRQSIPMPPPYGASTATTSPSKDEERDTLSNLTAFSTSHPEPNAFEPRSSSLAFPQGVTSPDHPRAGFGLGLPFSMSASANLSSLGSSTSPRGGDDTFGHSTSFTNSSSIDATPTTLSRRRESSSSSQTSDAGGQSSRSTSVSGPESPVTDRRQLIGLGELATPRWTSNVLERRWGAMDEERGEEDYLSTSMPNEPMPPFSRQVSVESPTMARLPASRPPAGPEATGRSFSYPSQAMHPTTLFPSTASPSISGPATPVGMSTFDEATFANSVSELSITSGSSPNLADSKMRENTSASMSPVSSRHETASSSGLRKRPNTSSTVPSASPAAPVPAASWLMSDPVVGLGFDYEPSGTGGDFLQDGEFPGHRRSSSGSVSTGRRSSTGKAIAIDTGKSSSTSTTPKSSTTHRRQSTSRSSFAHLPPSPAASTAAHVLAASGAPPPPPPALPIPSPGIGGSLVAAAMSHTATTHTTPGKTPEHARHSHHWTHQSSPSMVAASILRQTRERDLAAFDMDEAAAVDEGTAEALRKLDGLSSPRMSRVLSSKDGVTAPTTSSSASGPRSRTNSISRRTSEEIKTKRRTRNSLGEALAKEAENEPLPTVESASRPQPTTSVQESLSAHALSSPSFNSAASPVVQQGPPRSPLVQSGVQVASGATTVVASSPVVPATSSMSSTPIRTSSHASGHYDVPFPSSSPIHRGSSSSASLTAGTYTSHDSTSGASFSSYSLATTGPRSSSSKNRRSSMSSDVSSTQSVGEGGERRPLDRTDSGDGDVVRHIPPVPPLPKDWESYNRPPTAGTTSSAQNSPRVDMDYAARSSRGESAHLLSPRSAGMESLPSATSSINVSMPSPKVAAPPPTRKWSLSNAFSKSSKSPKASSIKESTSFTDLAGASQRHRKLSSTSHISEPGLPRRMAASTNDIAGLGASPQISPALSSGSFGRSSKHLSTFVVSSRERTISQSSNMTERTAQGGSSNATPSVVATSPGRSRSSLLSPRRTPSSIPFFSRGNNSSGKDRVPITTTPSPNLEQFQPQQQRQREASPPSDRSAGRKSILGLNFLRKDKDKDSKKDSKSSTSSTASSDTRKRMSTASSALSSAFDEPRMTDEFGRRPSVTSTSKTLNAAARKRGKTLSTVDGAQTFGVSKTTAALPPLHVPALSAATVRRVDSLSSTHSTSSQKTSVARVPVPSTTRVSKLQDSVKANLPTIVGSPSAHGFVPLADATSGPQPTRTSPSISPVPKSRTPTRIPRLGSRPPTNASDRATPRAPNSRDPSPVVGMSTGGAHSVSRRLSSYNSITPEMSILGSSAGSARPPSDSDTFSANDFGIAKREPGLGSGEKTLSTRRRLDSESQIPRSRSSALSSSTASTRTAKETPLDASTASQASAATTIGARTTRRHSIISGDDSKIASTPARAHPRTTSLSSATKSIGSTDLGTSTNSSRKPALRATELNSSAVSASKRTISSSVSAAAASTNDSMLSSSRSTRTLSTKLALPARITRSSTTPSLHADHATDSGRSSAASSQSNTVSEDEIRGDEEMGAYVRRQQAKKLAAGISGEAIRQMFEFPDPTEPLPPLNHRDAASLYSRYLSPYERVEIRDYDQVYFVGPNCDKKPATMENPTNNHGYDDDRGDYLLVSHDHIRFRYEVIDVLGKGSFGQVLQCRDHKTGEMVAIKIIRNKKRFHHQALVEIKVLENLVAWDPDEKHFVVRMVDSFTFRGHLCIVTELLSINLYELVKANSFKGFSTTLIRRFTIQILGSLSLLRHHRVVHCDLKPENILLKHPAKSAIKVIDFGSSCFEHEKVYTYIQSRFYRSPEVILGMNYHMAIDMWSLGCIIAEMYTGYPIFPGENEQEQLACIMEVMGLPDKYLIDRSSRKRLFFDSTGAARPVVNSKGRRRRPGTKTLAQVLKTDDELFLDFVTKCLAWDPDRRLKPDPALRHPWIIAARARAISPTIPPRTSRSSTTTGPSSVSGPLSSSISTPRKKVSTASSTSVANTAPVQRTRTQSSVTASSAARLSSKGSLQLPPSRGYSTVRASMA